MTCQSDYVMRGDGNNGLGWNHSRHLYPYFETVSVALVSGHCSHAKTQHDVSELGFLPKLNKTMYTSLLFSCYEKEF